MQGCIQRGTDRSSFAYIGNSDGFYWIPIIRKFIRVINVLDEALYYFLMNRDMELRSTKRESKSLLLMKLLSYSLKFTKIHIIVLEESSTLYVLRTKRNWSKEIAMIK
jgi:predicted proteasome-type protease